VDDPDVQVYNGETVLMKAVEKSYVEVIECMVSVSDPTLTTGMGGHQS
jgi:hypothetical protein